MTSVSSLGEALLRAREYRGLTRSQMARDMAGDPRSNVVQIRRAETGAGITVSTLLRMAAALRYEVTLSPTESIDLMARDDGDAADP